MAERSTNRATDQVDFREYMSHLDQVVVWSGDRSGFDYLSPGFEEIWGQSVHDALADRSVVLDGIHPEDRPHVHPAIDGSDERLADGTTIEEEHRVVQPDGTVRWVETRVVPVHEASGTLSKVVGVTIDITDRKEMEVDLERQNERLDEFTSIVSHDLRNPLNVADLQLELAQEDNDDDHLHAVGNALDRMETLIDDLLTLAREGDTDRETEAVVLDDLAEICWEQVETGDAELVTDSDRVVTATRSRLKQLVENLVRNAVEHGGDGVTVTVGGLEDGFFVADDGRGIPPDEREQVFETGYSTSREGTGFGLDIVQQIVDAYDWHIDVTDSADGGARFEITGVDSASA